MCTAAADTITLILCIVFSILFFVIGIFLFYVASKKIKNPAEECNRANGSRNSAQFTVTEKDTTTLADKPSTNFQTDFNAKASFLHTPVVANQDWSVLFGKIPTHILDLLWIVGKNCSDMSEPSAIDISLPINSENICPDMSIGYYPSYRCLSPEQRYCYLDWLQDITQSVDIGYVFLFYYGLERHLFYGNFNAAYNTIKILQAFHKNNSFLAYASDALLFSAAYHKRYDLLQQTDFSALAPEIVIYLKNGMHIPVDSGDIINIRRHIGFKNDRYIKEDYAKFKDIIDEILVQKYGLPSLPLTCEFFTCAREPFPIVLANYSLMSRIAFIPDISKSPKFSSTTLAILEEAHEKYKLSKRLNNNVNSIEPSTRYPKCNCDGCSKQSHCKYGHIIYDEFTKERMNLADKFIMLSAFGMDSFTPSAEPMNIITDIQDLYSEKKIDTYPKDIVENTLSYLQEEKKLYLSFGKCGRAYFNYMKMNGPISNLKAVLKNK